MFTHLFYNTPPPPSSTIFSSPPVNGKKYIWLKKRIQNLRRNKKRLCIIIGKYLYDVYKKILRFKKIVGADEGSNFMVKAQKNN